jgi:hypothetical protein
LSIRQAAFEYGDAAKFGAQDESINAPKLRAARSCSYVMPENAILFDAAWSIDFYVLDLIPQTFETTRFGFSTLNCG